MIMTPCGEHCTVEDGVTCTTRCVGPNWGCMDFTPRSCGNKDCAGTAQYNCAETVNCTGLTCVNGGYTCRDASCNKFYGQCQGTDWPGNN